jgi:hypothetical protein
MRVCRRRSFQGYVRIDLGLLINRGHCVILLLQLPDPGHKACSGFLVAFLDELDQVVARPEGVLPVVVAPRQLEYVLHLSEVIRDLKGVAAIFVTEELNDGVKPTPGNG